MMDWTDRHCRAFHRTMTAHALLYTEMVTTGAIIHGDRKRLLGFDAVEHPVAVQLGGSDPAALAQCARICEDLGYDEVNLNCGCPSDRVQNGAFGACLMREPVLVGACVAAMKAAVRIPVTVKCRIGVDEQDPHDALWAMTEQVVAAGVDALVVHARKAWLQGLSPKENRDVPPLDYALVHQLKAERPDLPIILNGGLATLESGRLHLDDLDGVMLGRAAYQNPDLLIGVDPLIFGEAAPVADGFEAVEAYLPYLSGQLAQGVRLHDMTRHMLGLFTGLPGARAWRRTLATRAVERGAGLEVVREALGHLQIAQNIAVDALP
ncbi:MAG: tRNA dihydrouridine synthase DusA [Hyphomicrobiales bacterium]|nr:tRNA dihydrouridine synthase DusA [Hyphomicrobiales bacterium]